ncbi:putative Hsp70 family chaperone [Seiridium unicorne]|uniref:Hsp70 family chaperone n=1 Tax=Seiridium unicorne TaxID=138068 RepID=A0ABR2UE02_9PEZI
MSWTTPVSSKDPERFMRKTSDVPNERWSMKGLMKRIKAKKNSNFDDILVIGIDFGTTYSGVAWATVDDFEGSEINVITSWPGSRREQSKVPTELFYEYDDFMWGYEVPLDADPIRWFKLLLLRDEDAEEELRQSDYYLRAKKMLRDLNKTPTDLIADYLKALWQHSLRTILKSRSKSVIAALAFHVVITVPAIWKDYARTGMQEAAAKAGILDNRSAGPTTLSFVPEPEAAALVTLCEYGSLLRSNDVYVICDAGGGTVDLISYKVGDLDPIELHEAVVGTGGLCGGIFIDEQFEHLCKQRLGRDWNNLNQSGIKSIMKAEWEYAYKPSYTGQDLDREFPVQIPVEVIKGTASDGMKRKPYIIDGSIRFSNSDIQKAFAPAFSSIEDLINGQIKAAKKKSLSVKGIVLVGGLGASPYLRNHLQAQYMKQEIGVLQADGMRPRTAICRGAIFKGFLDAPSAASGAEALVSVVSTVARKNLGVSYQPIFEAGVHRRQDKIWDDNEGVWRADNQMRWYLRKGDSVCANEPIRHNFYRSFATEEELDDEEGTLTSMILQCEDNVPPSRETGRVHELCKVSFDFASAGITFSSLEDYRGKNGKRLKKLPYELVVIPSGASTEFAIYYNGIRYGSQRTDRP